MKKLVLSDALGMFCYCTNNAMKKQIDINEILTIMIKNQVKIFKAKEKITGQGKNIYFTIKDEDGKVKKGKVLEFIASQFKEDQLQEAEFKNIIKKRIEQYFHLENQKDEDECTEDNLTEIFWNKEQNEEQQKIEGVHEEIRKYFLAIINAEYNLSKDIKGNYETKKAKKGEEWKEEEILREIIQECYGEEKNNTPDQQFSKNLEKLCLLAKIENKADVIGIIKRRITLDKNITEKNLESFLRQKIGIEEKKEVEQKIVNDHLKQEGCCPCCDCQKNCLKKKKKTIKAEKKGGEAAKVEEGKNEEDEAQ